MMTIGNKRMLLAVVLAALLLGAALTPAALQLRTISSVMDQFRVDDAVHREIMKEDPKKLTVDQVLDPPFLKRFGLASNDYLDKDGYFAPNGSHWARWSLETKTAAILMWADSADLSAWRVRELIAITDDYYLRNELTTPVVKVVRATLGK